MSVGVITWPDGQTYLNLDEMVQTEMPVFVVFGERRFELLPATWTLGSLLAKEVGK